MGQVLYTDVAEYLPEYATLKAIGYTYRALLMVVLQEAMPLAILGLCRHTPNFSHKIDERLFIEGF
ncbi:hypothetical protein AM10699_61360 (plasmid) [Acaryochloris marina MBIC10699]|nr:hypothetical protein AM10699_61360 [Acaryochloris marina MBIC10699]